MKILKSAWKGWIRVAELIGNFQMIVLLSILYWFGMSLLALPMKLLSDPLSLKKPGVPTWSARKDDNDLTDSMKRQG